ncbi:hypothetical protein B0H14DRAFT_3898857 [Mycena olivaceomarginata]|nr:hypothetical protein B0H14DRAFT_3898857 [Mycena olivaceomarginata]
MPRSHSRSRSPEDYTPPPRRLSHLRDEKRKYFDELSGEGQKLLPQVCKGMEQGKLISVRRRGSRLHPAESQTGYKWSFAANKSRVDNAALRALRRPILLSAGRSIRGPTLPSSADLAYARELASESAHADASLKRKRDRAEAKERVEDMVGPREVGREGALEKKRARREADRSFRERGDDGLEADEGVLLGGGDSFKAQIAKRDAAQSRRSQKYEDKTAVVRERQSVYKEKETATMAMFQALAKERFG